MRKLRFHCDTSITNNYGQTSLHLAAKHGHTAAVKALLAHTTCDTSITDSNGRTAADVARERGHADIATMIDAGASGKSALLPTLA